MSALRLADVRDPDCVASFRPLAFDMSRTGRTVKGVNAVLRRVLVRICSRRGTIRHAPGKGVDIRDLEGASLDTSDVLGWQMAIEREAGDVNFVRSARCKITLDAAGNVAIALTVVLVDGVAYALEVTIDEAGAALRKIGAA
jgi:hypothetical protein